MGYSADKITKMLAYPWRKERITISGKCVWKIYITQGNFR